MSVTAINVLLWAPLVLAVIISGIIFCLSGYKRGLWRALLSLGGTLLSAALAVLLARVISRPAGDSAARAVSAALGETSPLLGGALEYAVRGIAGTVCALLLFFVIFLLLAIVVKLLCGHIGVAALDRGQDAPGMKWGGAGVRLADALLFSVLLLLPLYGTLAAYVPAVERCYTAIAEMGGSGVFGLSAETRGTAVPLDAPASVPSGTYPLSRAGSSDPVLEVLHTVSRHPAVAVASLPPFQGVYGGLTRVPAGEGSFDLAATANSFAELLERWNAFANGPEQMRKENLLRLLTYVRENVVEEDWFYTLCTEGLRTGSQTLSELLDGSDDDPMLNALLQGLLGEVGKLADCPREKFVETADGLLRMVEALCDTLGEDLQPAPLDREEDAQAFAAAIGEALNGSEEGMALKQALYDCALSAAGLEDAPGELFTVEQYTDSESRAREILSLLLLLSAGTREDVRDALLIHPGANEENILAWYQG